MVSARLALGLWSNLANITFKEVNVGSYTDSATILFGNFSNTSYTNFAYSPSSNDQSFSSRQGDVWLNVGRFPSMISPAVGTDVFKRLVHEIGHAIGLSHPGDYNFAPGEDAIYSRDAEYIEDSLQYSIMSYFDAIETGANHVYGGVTIKPRTPMLHDVAAVQRIYGANVRYATGNDVYGFDNTANTVFAISNGVEQVVYCIWDAGGTDTLNFSGYSNNQKIDLRQGAFSDVGALSKNVSIAFGSVIENAISGGGNDAITGNDADNSLYGKAGNDTIDGGVGVDVTVYQSSYSVSTIIRNSNGTVTISSVLDGTDTLINMEFAQFSDRVVSLINSSPLHFGKDFNADAHSDILLQSASNGSCYVWQMNGLSLIPALSNGYGYVGWTPGSGWQAKATGDFNGDGKSDILLQNTADGACYVWETNGANNPLVGNGYVGWTPGKAWEAKATGDFNGDGKSDILLQNSNDGSCYIWELNGTGPLVANGYVGWTPGSSWQAKATGDFNGDGKSDILLQNSNDGSCYIWELNGTGPLVANGYVGWTPGKAWEAKGTGDFNGDGKSDILLQNANDGTCYIWELNGTGPLVGNGYVGWTPGKAWEAKGTGDYNGDGKSDILLQNATDGTCYVWELNGTGPLVGNGYVGWTPGADWHAVA